MSKPHSVSRLSVVLKTLSMTENKCFGAWRARRILRKKMAGLFVPSSCGVLEKKVHLVRPHQCSKEEHGNLRGKVSNPRFDTKLLT